MGYDLVEDVEVPGSIGYGNPQKNRSQFLVGGLEHEFYDFPIYWEE